MVSIHDKNLEKVEEFPWTLDIFCKRYSNPITGLDRP